MNFQRASCEDCRDITGAVENECLRGPFLSYRIRKGFPSRRKGAQWPKELPVNVALPGGAVERRMVPHHEQPLMLALPVYGLARATQGQSVHIDDFKPGMWLYRDPESWKGKVGTGVSGSLNVIAFARMIAKIAHSFAFAKLRPEGLADFELVLPELIRFGSERPFDFVGNEPPLKANIPNLLHSMDTILSSRGETQFLVVRVHLFPEHGAPVYHAIVGRRPMPKSPFESSNGALERLAWTGDKNRDPAHLAYPTARRPG